MRVNTTSLEVKLRAILDHEIKTHKIKVRKFFKHENADGTCFPSYKVDLARPVDAFNLGCAFHEIGHVVTKVHDISQSTFIEEYRAEIFAIDLLKKYKLPTRKYIAIARNYVLRMMAKEYNTGALDIDLVPEKIKKFTGLQVKKWKSAKKVYVKNETYHKISKKSDIQIRFK